MMPLLVAVLAATVAAAPPPAPTAAATVAAMRDAMRDACAKLRGTAPETAATRGAFKRCLAQIHYDGDLPAAAPRTR